jgi:S1-C subfamily serine protease
LQLIAGGSSAIRKQSVDLIMSDPLGHIGDVLKDKIVYDAATTFGGPGGPLFNRNGKVIGVTSTLPS